jgi:glycine/D-amino acid oxidase-like deaminating enzyme
MVITDFNTVVLQKYTERMKTITIIGCGAIGAMLAYQLSKIKNEYDLDITVLEANAQPAMVATGAALGVLMAASSSRARGHLVKLRLASLSLYDRLIDELIAQTNHPILYNRNGILNLYRSPDAETTARSLIKIRQRQGFEMQWLDREQISQQFPQWQAEGGLLSQCDRAVHPTELVKALVAAATENGVKFCWNAPVKDLQDLPCDRIVVTAGLGSNPLLSPILKQRDQDLLQPIGGQALLLRVPDLNLQNVVHIENEDSSDINIVPLGNDQYWLGATVEFNDHQLPREANVSLLREQAIARCPNFKNAEVLGTWSGDRPRPDGFQSPILGFVPNYPHILIASGHYRNGILMAPITAQITQDLLLTGASDSPWKSFAII